MQDLQGILQQELDLYQEILQLSKAINSALKRGQPQNLALLFAQKEDLIRKAANLQAQLDRRPFVVTRPLPQLQILVRLIQETIDLDRENEDFIQKQLGQVEHELKKMQQSVRVRQAYNSVNRKQEAVFVDRKK